jgi:CheY-like chemotaxis protein
LEPKPGVKPFSLDFDMAEILLLHCGRMRNQDEKPLGRRILLVEDQRMVRETVRLLLSQDAHTIVEANNGAEAFGLFAGGHFDLVMTDFEMPFVKGDELAARIKRVSPNQPILMITSYGQRPSSDNPVDAVLSKPFGLNGLRTAIAKLL